MTFMTTAEKKAAFVEIMINVGGVSKEYADDRWHSLTEADKSSPEISAKYEIIKLELMNDYPPIK